MKPIRKKIAILGGSFDPVTLAHVNVAKVVKEQTDVDEVWMIPCFKHAHAKNLTNFDDRLNMLRLSIADEHQIFACTIEKTMRLSGYTKDLYIALTKSFSSCEFKIVMGQDVANNFDNFYESAWLKENANFIILNRTGIPPIENPWYDKKCNTLLNSDKFIYEVSSTLARNSIKEKNYSQSLMYLHPSVIDYAIKNNLYA